jgi:Na+/proline symporter
MWLTVGLLFAAVMIGLLFTCKRHYKGWRVNRDSFKLGERMRHENPPAFTLKKRQW